MPHRERQQEEEKEVVRGTQWERERGRERDSDKTGEWKENEGISRGLLIGILPL